jgi:tRNA uridine 5-carboxymethylaminomethyl modification enzyme
MDSEILSQLMVESTYDQYAERQTREVSDLQRQESQRIPEDFDYGAVSGLSGELKLKLARRRPETILQASRIEGMTPAALVLLLGHLKKPRQERLAG